MGMSIPEAPLQKVGIALAILGLACLLVSFLMLPKTAPNVLCGPRPLEGFSSTITEKQKVYEERVIPAINEAEILFRAHRYCECQRSLTTILRDIDSIEKNYALKRLISPREMSDVEYRRLVDDIEANYQLPRFWLFVKAKTLLADAYFLNRQYDKARPHYEQLLLIGLQQFGPNANSEFHRQVTRRFLPRDAAYLKTTDENCRRQTDSQEHCDSFANMIENAIDLAIIYDVSGKPQLAEPLYLSTMRFFNFQDETSLSPGLREFSTPDYSEMGMAHRPCAHTQERQSLLLMIAKGTNSSCRLSNGQLSTRFELLGRDYFNQKLYKESARYYRKAIALREQEPTIDIENLTLDLKKTRICMVAQDNPKGALETGLKLLRLQRNNGLSGEQVDELQIHLADELWRNEQPSEAISLLKSCLSHQIERLGLAAPAVIRSMNTLADWLPFESDSLSDAGALLHKVMEIRRNPSMNSNVQLSHIVEKIAKVMKQNHCTEEAEELYKQELSIRQRPDWNENVYTRIDLLNQLAQCYQSRGELAQGEDVLRQALDLAKRGPSTGYPPNEGLVNQYVLLARFMSSTNRYIEACALLEKAVPLYEQDYGDNHSDWLLRELRDCYRRSGNCSAAEQLDARLRSAQ